MMNWCIKRKFFRHDVYDDKGTKTAGIYMNGRHVRVVSDNTGIWEMQRGTSDDWKIIGPDCEYFAKIQPDQEADRLLFPLKKQMTLEINKEIYRIEQLVWLDARVYCGQREIAAVRRKGLSDMIFTMQTETERDFSFLLAGLAVLMQYEEQRLLNVCCR